MKYIIVIIIILSTTVFSKNLLTERKGFETKLLKKKTLTEKLITPPSEIFKIVKYNTKLGKMSAYISQHKESNEKRAAIIWLTGGFPASSPGKVWREVNTENEQTASVYRNNGIVMMFPSLRGINNPGNIEQFYGEVEDVISAGEYLKTLKHIDPKRIYLGGHSTGGTLALLVSESTDIFAGVISLGPTDYHYGEENSIYKWTEDEIYYRAPINFLSYIKTPTYIIEGEYGNAYAIKNFKEKNKIKPNKNLRIAIVNKANHFSLIHPVNSIFTKAILESKDGKLKINIDKEIKPVYINYRNKEQEIKDLNILVYFRTMGIEIKGKKIVKAPVYSYKKEELSKLIKEAKSIGFKVSDFKEVKNEKKLIYIITIEKEIEISKLTEVFSLSKKFRNLVEKHGFNYYDWFITQ